jgi:hypothetical protein
MVVGFQHVRHWNPTTMWDTGIPQKCQTLKSYHHVRHWNSTNMPDTEILPPCHYVSDFCGIPTYRMNLRLQCLIWLWGFNTSHGYGITVYETLEFHSYVRYWHFTAMWNTGIPQRCENLKFHNNVRHWNYIAMWDTGIPPWLWNYSVSHCCGIPMSHIHVKFQCLTLLWNSSVSHCCKIPVSRIAHYSSYYL